MKRLPHVVLEIPVTATPKQIKKAYRRLSKKYHPDLNMDGTNSAEMFMEVKDAYEALSRGYQARSQSRETTQPEARADVTADRAARANAAFTQKMYENIVHKGSSNAASWTGSFKGAGGIDFFALILGFMAFVVRSLKGWQVPVSISLTFFIYLIRGHINFYQGSNYEGIFFIVAIPISLGFALAINFAFMRLCKLIKFPPTLYRYLLRSIIWTYTLVFCVNYIARVLGVSVFSYGLINAVLGTVVVMSVLSALVDWTKNAGVNAVFILTWLSSVILVGVVSLALSTWTFVSHIAVRPSVEEVNFSFVIGNMIRASLISCLATVSLDVLSKRYSLEISFYNPFKKSK